jgi:myo-inositol-1(or 4)-monophosphatase
MLTPSELDGCIELIEELSAFAAERIVAVRPRREEISTKTNLADWVTETDLAVERHVRAAVLERFPAHQVVGEEYGTTGRDDPQARWYVDPVDGTTNFVHALPWSSFSIAVVDDEGPAAGAVVDPYRGEMLAAARGRGATRNGEPIRCSDDESLTGGIVLTELSAQSLWDGLGSFMAGLAAVGCVTRIMGSNALTLANVGAGRASAAVIGAFGPVDCLAGSLIAREAGARVIAPSGAEWPEPGEWFACAAPGIADELVRIAGERLNGGKA